MNSYTFTTITAATILNFSIHYPKLGRVAQNRTGSLPAAKATASNTEQFR